MEPSIEFQSMSNELMNWQSPGSGPSAALCTANFESLLSKVVSWAGTR